MIIVADFELLSVTALFKSSAAQVFFHEMGRHSEFSDSQLSWLKERKGRFRDAQDTGAFTAFWKAILDEWYQAFPHSPNTSQEDSKAHAQKMKTVTSL